MDTAIIESEALKMSECHRAVLADRLLESLERLPGSLTAAWTDEVNSRMAAYKDGHIQSVDGLDALEKLRAKLTK